MVGVGAFNADGGHEAAAGIGPVAGGVIDVFGSQADPTVIS